MTTIPCTAFCRKESERARSVFRKERLPTHRTPILGVSTLPFSKAEEQLKNKPTRGRNRPCKPVPAKGSAGQAADEQSHPEKGCKQGGELCTPDSLPSAILAFRSEKTDWHSGKQKHKQRDRLKGRKREGCGKVKRRGRNHNYLNASRIGEASNPGPNDTLYPCDSRTVRCGDRHWHLRSKKGKKPEGQDGEPAAKKKRISGAERRIISKKQARLCESPEGCNYDHYHEINNYDVNSVHTGSNRAYDRQVEDMEANFPDIHGWSVQAAHALREMKWPHPSGVSPLEDSAIFKSLISLSETPEPLSPPAARRSAKRDTERGDVAVPTLEERARQVAAELRADSMLRCSDPNYCNSNDCPVDCNDRDSEVSASESEEESDDDADQPPLRPIAEPVQVRRQPVPPVVPPPDEPAPPPPPLHPVVVFQEEVPARPPNHPLVLAIHDDYEPPVQEVAQADYMDLESVVIYITGKETALTFREHIGKFFANLFPGITKTEYLSALSNKSPIIFETIDHKRTSKKWGVFSRSRQAQVQRDNPEWKRHHNTFVSVHGYNQVASVFVYPAVYELLSSNEALFRRKMLDPDGKMLDSFLQACRKVVSDDKARFRFWSARQIILCNSILYFTQQTLLAGVFENLVCKGVVKADFQ